MSKKFSFTAFFISVIIGAVLLIAFSWATGPKFSNALFPSMSILAAFMVTGFLTGILSKDITISEPGIGSIVLAVIGVLVIPAMKLKGFEGVTASDWLLIMMNGIIFTFLGAWLGEKFQHGVINAPSSDSSEIDWGWIVAGTIFGIGVSLILVILLDLVFGHNPSSFIIPFIIALLLSGLVIGWKSPGVTIIEAGLAGFLTITADLNILRLTIFGDTMSIDLGWLIGALVVGFVTSLAGGFIGEGIQKSKAKK